jgi:hypothetical protein
LRRLLAGGPRASGLPRSANGASSFHLRWGGLPAPLVEVSAVLEVVAAPAVPRLYFWALQAGFPGGGAGHLGLQWYPAHPGSTAVNWGGYDPSGRVLDGTTSALPSATGNPNTRDLAWEAARPYRLAIAAGERGWRGSVTDLTTGEDVVVRELLAPGPHLSDPMVWSEVFARCDDPPVAVRWSGFAATASNGSVVRPDRLTVSYQRHADGGCDNTTVRRDGDGVVQVTNAPRDVPHGAVLPF